MRFSGLLWLLLFAVAVSCGKKKEPKSSSVGVTEKREQPPAILSEFIAWPQNYWVAKAKVNLTMQGNSFTVNLTLRAERDKCIWFSANAMGLLEIARGKIDADSARFLDKFHNTCYVGDLNGLGEFLPVPLKLSQLQHFLMGKVFWDSLAAGQKRINGDTSFLSGVQGDASFRARILQKYNLIDANAALSNNDASVSLLNTNFKPVSGFPVAFKKEVQSRVKEDGKLNETQIRIEFTKFEFVAEKPDLDFELPSDCERKVIK
jgi:hypothetical protein